MSHKFSINLLTPELLPEKATLTLGRMIALWGGGTYRDVGSDLYQPSIQCECHQCV